MTSWNIRVHNFRQRQNIYQQVLTNNNNRNRNINQTTKNLLFLNRWLNKKTNQTLKTYL